MQEETASLWAACGGSWKCIGKLDARMAVIAIIELVTLCVVVSVDGLNPVDEIRIG
jgi:hypothetical protein